MDPLDLINALLSDEGRDDPYPLYAELRKHGSLITVQPDYLVATSYQAVDAVLRDARLGVQDASLLLLERSMLNTNPPDHTRMRRLVSGAFTPKRIAELEYAITTQAQRLAAQMLEKGGIRDLMEEFAYRLPVAVICELLGIPERDREWFRPVASDFAVVLEGTMTELEMSAALSAAELLQAYFTDLVRTRRGTQTMIGEMADSDALTHAELLGNLALLLLAGFETTTNLIGQRADGPAAASGRPGAAARRPGPGTVLCGGIPALRLAGAGDQPHRDGGHRRERGADRAGRLRDGAHRFGQPRSGAVQRGRRVPPRASGQRLDLLWRGARTSAWAPPWPGSRRASRFPCC
jgi:hypothetical protein